MATIAIVGAGFAGLSTAWWLARNVRAEILVFEQRSGPALQASGRGAGLGRQLCDDDDTSQLAIAGANVLRTIAGVWQETGSELLFVNQATYHEYLARAKRCSIKCTSGQHGDEYWIATASDGLINVRALADFYYEQAKCAGVEFGFGSRITAVREEDRHATVIVNQEARRVDAVVDACGAWGGKLANQVALTPTKRHLFECHLDNSRADKPGFRWRIDGSQCYVRKQAGIALASVCDEVPCDPDDENVSAAVIGSGQLRPGAESLFVGLNFESSAVRCCQRTFAHDRKMFLRRDDRRPWLFSALALGGHGATCSPAIGEQVGKLLATSLQLANRVSD